MNKSFVILSILLLVSFQLSCQNLSSEFDVLMDETFEADGPGGVALVAIGEKVLYRKAFGMANLELGVPMSPEHVFRIGSITKQFTACTILKLVEEGKLDLQDDIRKFIKDYPTHGHTITIEHLLTHTSGIRSFTGMEEWDAEFQKKDFTPASLVDFFKDQSMDFAPGEEWKYNNSAYFLLGYIIEIITGNSYAHYLEENLFQDLGMENSYYGSTSKIIPGRADGYAKGPKGYRNAEFISMTQPHAAGALLSTVDDLFRWHTAVMNHEVINKEDLEQATSSYVLNNGEETAYGYGWALGEIKDSPTISHGGGINGFRTASIYLPEEKIFVAVFSNCTCKDPDDIASRMAKLSIKELRK